MTDNASNHPILLQESPWSNNENNIWLASTIQFLRNMEKFKFPNKLDSSRSKQIISLIEKEFNFSELLQNPQLFSADVIGPLEKEFLMEHFLTSRNFLQTHLGEAFLIDDSGTFLMTVNIQDHFNLQITDSHGNIENSWNRLVSIETALGKLVNYAYSPRFGFLTANSMHSGTAMQASIFLQLTALIHTGQLEEILAKHYDEGVYITGLQGDPEQFIGDVVTVHNRHTLGVSEENIITILRRVTTKLMVEENTIRNHLRKEENADLKDQVSRAFGVLTLSYQAETLEAMDAIALLKLGVDLGWVSGVTLQELNLLFFNCRRAHLVRKFEEEMTPEELLHKRAEYIHEKLKDTKLEI